MSDGGAATRSLVESLLRALNEHDVETVLGLYSEDVTNHGVRVGRAGMELVHRAIFEAFPDWTIAPEELVVTEHRAVLRGRLQGHYTAPLPSPLDQRIFGGALADIAPTGQRIDIDAIHIWGIDGGAVNAHWAVRDDLSMRRQAGRTR